MTERFHMADHPHRRLNPLTGEWLLVSPHRAKRPWQGKVNPPQTGARPAYDPACYLCPGNTRAEGAANPAYTGTYVFDNDFAALLPGTPPGRVAHHFQRLGHAGHFLDRGQLGKFGIGARRGEAQRADALGNEVQRRPLFGILLHEHHVQRVEHRPGDVPVEVVRHQVERVAVGQQTGQALSDPGAVIVGDTDVDFGDFGYCLCFHGNTSEV